eukprot:scaffold10163_cov108-Isochrysis_galbana.AAC.6
MKRACENALVVCACGTLDFSGGVAASRRGERQATGHRPRPTTACLSEAGAGGQNTKQKQAEIRRVWAS